MGTRTYNIHRAILAFLITTQCITAFAQDPSLMMTLNDFHERAEIAQREPWARTDLMSLIQGADQFPASYEKRFGLTSVELPPEGGQWLHWYVCPETGARCSSIHQITTYAPIPARNTQVHPSIRLSISFATMRYTWPQ